MPYTSFPISNFLIVIPSIFDIRRATFDIQISNSRLLLNALADTVQVIGMEFMDRASGSQF